MEKATCGAFIQKVFGNGVKNQVQLSLNSTFDSGLNKPHAIIYYEDTNRLYVNSSDNNIMQYDLSGTKTLFVSGLNNPSSMIFNTDGFMYISEFYNNRILRYNFITGSYYDVFASSLNSPTCMFFEPGENIIPEPLTLLSMLIGFLLCRIKLFFRQTTMQ